MIRRLPSTLSSRQTTGVGIIRRPIDTFPLIQEQLVALEQQTGLVDLPREGFIMYGSAVRALWTKELCGDINIALLGSERSEPRPAALSPIVSIAAKEYASAEAILQEADFTVCQLACHDGYLYFTPPFFEHLAQKLLVVNHIDRANAYVTLLRTYKFAQRGFSISYGQYVSIVEALPPDLSPLDALAARRHSGGVIIL